MEDNAIRIAKEVARRYRISGMERTDVEQEAILVALRHKEKENGYIRNKVRRHLGGLISKQKKYEPLENDPPMDSPPDLPMIPWDILREILSTMEFRVLQSIYYYGDSHEEASNIWGIPKHRVRKYLNKALEKLRGQIEIFRED